jgi:hypothetical protein
VGRVSTADDPGQNITVYEYPTSLRGQKFERFWLTNDENVGQNFKSFEVGMFKRMSRGWQIMASYSATRKHIPLTVGLSQSEFNSNVYAGDMNPNAEINTSDDTWESTGKLSGAYSKLPFGFTVSANFEHRSGSPFARTVLYTGGVTIPSLVVNAEPIGTRKLDDINLTDVRIEKSLSLSGSHRATFRANIFNAMNASTVLAVVDRSGSTFLQPTSIVPPRIVELSIAYSF